MTKKINYPKKRLPRGDVLSGAKGRPKAKRLPTCWEELGVIERKFIYELPVDNDKAAAMKRAGSTIKTNKQLNSKANDLLRIPFIKKMVIEREREIAEKTIVTAARIQEEMACIAFTSTKDYYDENDNLLPISQLSDSAARALGGFEVIQKFTEEGEVSKTFLKKIKSIDKKGMLDTLAKIHGMLVDKHEVIVRKMVEMD